MYQIGDEELEAIGELFKSKQFFRYYGKGVVTQTLTLESEFSSYIGMNHSLFVTSGTNALILALKSAGVEKGDEVIVPSYTFVATIAAILHVGAIPVLSSVGNGLTLDPQFIESKITPKTKAIIPVHMDGYPVSMNEVMNIAQKNNLIVIEDVAQAVGGEFLGKKLGTFGRSSCFSFNVDKIITCGEGGMVSFQNEDDFKKALMLHDAPVRYGATFKDYLSEVAPELGFSMRMSEISAVILRKQLTRLPGIIQKLRTNKNLLLQSLQCLDEKIIKATDPHGECATHLHFKFSDPLEAGEMARKLTEKGITAIPLYARPAHCYWHWQEWIQSGVQEVRQDRIHLSSIVRLSVNFDLSSEKLAEQAELIKKIMMG